MREKAGKSTAKLEPLLNSFKQILFQKEKENLPLGDEQMQKRNIVRKIVKKQKQVQELAEEKALQSLNLKTYLKKEWTDLASETGGKPAKFILMVQAAKKATSAMKLPEAKKKLIQKLFLEEIRIGTASVDPIPKKEAEKIIERLIQTQKQALSEARNPTKQQIAQTKKAISKFEEIKREIRTSRGEQVKINRESAEISVQYYDWLYRRLLGEENYRLFIKAMKQTAEATRGL
jgi:hypothetical protein